MTKKIVALAGDGIGPEIMAAGLEVLAAVAEKLALIIVLKTNHLGELGLMPLATLFPRYSKSS